MPAQLKFFYGPMDCGKSTLALQIDHNHARQGRHGPAADPLRPLRAARPSPPGSGWPRAAIEVDRRHRHPRCWCASEWAARPPAGLPDRRRGRLPRPRARRPAGRTGRRLARRRLLLRPGHRFPHQLLPGAKRLFELADEMLPVHVEVLCWCGRPGQLNARVVDGRVVREGDTVVVADTDATPTTVPCTTRCCAGRTTAAAISGATTAARSAQPRSLAAGRRPGCRSEPGMQPRRPRPMQRRVAAHARAPILPQGPAITTASTASAAAPAMSQPARRLRRPSVAACRRRGRSRDRRHPGQPADPLGRGGVESQQRDRATGASEKRDPRGDPPDRAERRLTVDG